MTFPLEAMRKAAARATDGPWRFGKAARPVDGCFDWGIKGYISGEFEIIVECFARSGKNNFPPAEANATLIALAPDMVAEIERLVETNKEQALQLIAALGQTYQAKPCHTEAEMDNLRETNMALVAALRTAREDALKEAADEVRDWQAFTLYGKERISEEMAQAILALTTPHTR